MQHTADKLKNKLLGAKASRMLRILAHWINKHHQRTSFCFDKEVNKYTNSHNWVNKLSNIDTIE